jgi:glycerol-3-phosphate acyltransferase PlsY
LTAEIILLPLSCLALAYGLGSIPFGLLLTRAAGLGDVRAIGSGNIGATNVLRTGRKGLAAATLLLDAAKGAAAVLLAAWIWPDQPNFPGIAAIGAFLGHLFPVWLGFKGGKGLATAVGILAVLHWQSAAIAGAVWLVVVVLSRISSAGGIAAAISAPIVAAFFGRIDFMILVLGFTLHILWKHRSNIARLVAGTEPKLGKAAT